MPEATVEGVGEESPTSRQLREEDAYRSRVREYLDRERAAVRSEFVGVLDELTRPNESRIPAGDAQGELRSDGERRNDTERWNDRQDRFGYGDVRDMSDYLYSTLPKYAQRIRNPRTDKQMADFLRAVRWRNWEAVERTSRQLNGEYTRALAEGESELDPSTSPGPGTGAPFLPLPLANLIIMARDARAKVRQFATRFTSNNQSLKVPVSGVDTGAQMVGEGAVATEDTPTLTSKLMQKRKGQSRFRASDELLEDSAFNLVSFFAERGGSSLGALEDIQFCRGLGVDPGITESIESATITGVAEAMAGTISYVDCVTLFFDLPEQYRTQGVFWMGNSLMMRLLSTIVDGDSRPIFTPGVIAPRVVTSEGAANGIVGSIFGHPVLELPFTTGTSPVDASLFVGVLANYGYLDGGGLTVRASEHTRWAQDEVEWKITQRFDGVVLLEDSFREMAGITTV
jgi:HK97 family phage major capsid protein